MYRNDTERGGRPNTDEAMRMKLLVLQSWYGLSDPELERQAFNRIDFMHFLGYPEAAPDYSTVWQFRERLAETCRDRLVWEELQRQLAAKGLRVRKASPITPASSRRTRVRRGSRVGTRRRPGGAGTVTG